MLGAPTPVLRIFDEAKAREFYCDFLGFTVDWEHRFGDDFPLYMQVSSGVCRLHLSEHYGDASPGAQVRIESDDVDAFAAALRAKAYKYARPGVEATPWGNRESRLTDPFGNRLTFFTPADKATET
ncbi:MULTISPECIES: glyoxalase superfamily protein [Rhodomicrobium]|uniref:glyoxalase superfamily protein n=1 Tax=Rhodomicrobium TaxID=1068 RepID=UPI000B4B898A|nr:MULTISPECIES: glyoxalase superfamily protein [Rhodomicrobium]